jgi:hypothetical protein
MDRQKIAKMKTLLENIRARSGISQEEAEEAVMVMLGYLAASLPSPLMGRVSDALSRDANRKVLGKASK